MRKLVFDLLQVDLGTLEDWESSKEFTALRRILSECTELTLEEARALKLSDLNDVAEQLQEAFEAFKAELVPFGTKSE